MNASPGYNITTTVNTQMGRVTTNTMLFISNLRREMHGSYECRATNHQGFFKEMATAIVYCECNFCIICVSTGVFEMCPICVAAVEEHLLSRFLHSCLS